MWNKEGGIARKDSAVDLGLTALFAGQRKAASDRSLTWSCGVAFNPFIKQIFLDLSQNMLDGSSCHPRACYEAQCAEFAGLW